MSERVERSGWRDQAYSDWHRQLQFRPEYRAIAGGYYMLDLDAVEYRHGKETVALLELKRGEEPTITGSQLKVLVDLAKRAQVPLFQVNYRFTPGAAQTPPRDAGDGVEVTWDKWETWEFKVTALNDLAMQVCNGISPTPWIGEDRYIKFLGLLGA